jgi:hypothetical protein
MATAALPFGYQSTNDPRKLASNNRQIIAQGGQQLQQQNQDQYNQGTQQADQTGGYLTGIESPLAQGQGGYLPSEVSQIQMTPEQQQAIVSGAGTTAGAATAAGADAAERAANAAGGNPAALAAYRARAAQQEGTQAGTAETQAKIAASNAAAQRAENIGQTRIGQQNAGLNYFSGVQQMQNQNAQNAANRQNQAYGTETSGLNQNSQVGLQASQTPSTFDKVLGGVAGAAGGFLGLEEGAPPGTMRDAVVAERGPEAVLKMAAGPYQYLDDGDTGSGEAGTEGSAIPSQATSMGDDTASQTPFWKQVLLNAKNSMANQQQQSNGGNARPMSGTGQQWNPTTPYQQAGQVAGGLAKLLFLDDGVMSADNGAIFTKPTRVGLEPNEAAVPLNYRAQAKTRPSMAMPVVNQIQRKMFGVQPRA